MSFWGAATSCVCFLAGFIDDNRQQGSHSSGVAERTHLRRSVSSNVSACLESVFAPQQEQISLLHITPFLGEMEEQRRNDSLTDYQSIQTSTGSFPLLQQRGCEAHFRDRAAPLYPPIPPPKKKCSPMPYMSCSMHPLSRRFMVQSLIPFLIWSGPTETSPLSSV